MSGRASRAQAPITGHGSGNQTLRARSGRSGLAAFSLKQQRCPRCQACETLNRHSLLFGNDPAQADGSKLRGQRVYCSNRGAREGCGHTFSIFLADVLPRHTASASFLWPLLLQLLTPNTSVRSAAHALGLPLALESIYHLLGRLRRRLDVIRVCLSRRARAPDSRQRQPLLQTVEHLQTVFADAARGDCLITRFQLVFQQPLMG